MADKKHDKYLCLYPEDFVDAIWNEVCEVLDRNVNSTEIRIYFTDDDIISYTQEEEY